MEFNLIGYENGKEVKVPIPFDEIVKQFWPYHNAPSKVAVSTSLGDDSAIAELPAYDGAKIRIPALTLIHIILRQTVLVLGFESS